MAVNLSPIGGVAAQFLDNSGNVLSGGKIFTYTAGTTTPQATYTSSNGATPLANPIILDAAGRVPTGEIWLTDGLQYKFIIKTSTDVQLGSYDNIVGINSNFVNYTNSQEIQTATAGQTVFTLTTMQYQPGTNSLSVFVDGVNQYGPGASYAYQETSSTVVTFTSGLHVGADVKFTTSAINASSAGDATQIAFTGFNGAVGTVADLADNNGADLVGFLQNGSGAIARSAQNKMRDVVSVKDFGAVGNGMANDTAAVQAAWDAVAAQGGGTIFFPTGTYLCNLVGRGDDNVSLLGTGHGSVLKSYAPNNWAVKYNNGFPSLAISVQNISFRDDTNARTTHGLYVNTGTGFSLRNVAFYGLGIGFCENATFGFDFTCCFFNNYCDVFCTASIGANTAITNINGQTVNITNAFFNQHPGIQLWMNCRFDGKINYYFEQPDNPYDFRAALTFINCVAQPLNGVGFHFRDAGFARHIAFINSWIEGSLSPSLLRSYTLPAKYIYARGSAKIMFDNALLSDCLLEEDATMITKNAFIYDENSVTATTRAAYFHQNATADANGGFNFNSWVESAVPFTRNRPIFLHTTPKTNISRAYNGSYLVYSNRCFAADTLFTSYGATSNTKITTDSAFETLESFSVVANTSNGVNLGSTAVDDTKVYVFTIAVKGVGADVSLILTDLPMGGVSKMTAKNGSWTTYAGIGVPDTGVTAANPLFTNVNVSPANWLISGYQLLKFDNWNAANEFLASNTFNI